MGVSGYFDRQSEPSRRAWDEAGVHFRDTDPRPRGIDALVPTGGPPSDIITPDITRREQAMFKRAADRAALVDLMLKADTILADAPDAVDQAGTLADAILDRGLYLRG